MKILIASSIDPLVIETLCKRHDVVCAFNAPEEKLQSLIVDRDVLIFRSGVNISSEVMACAPTLKLLIRAGSGLDNLNLNDAHSRGMKLVRIHEPGRRVCIFHLRLLSQRYPLAYAIFKAKDRRI